MKHTPGEWHEDGFLFIGVDSEGGSRGWFRLQDEKDPYPESEVTANQRLCAAAPKLLEACEAFVEAIEGYERRTGRLHFHPCVDLARAALAKAKGGDHE